MNYTSTVSVPSIYNNDLGSNYITYVCVSTPNLEKLKRNFEFILPYVDKAVIVTGREDEEAEKFLAGFEQVTVVYRPWSDSFKDQYQVGLDIIKGGWMLWLDDDEIPSVEMLKSLRGIVQQSQDATRFDTVSFRCCDVWDGQQGEPSDYYREMFTAWNPHLCFEINLHQAMMGKRKGARCNDVYYHHKTQEGSMRGSCRNFFAAGVWADAQESFEYWYKLTGEDPRVNRGAPLVPQSQGQAYPLQDGFRIDSWHEMKDILARNHSEITYFHQLDPLIRNGEVCQEFVEWAERHNEKNDTRPHVHELHKFDMYIKHWAEKRGSNA